MEDWKLIREYVDKGSETAFTTLVNRHIGLVYSVALRRLGNPHIAEEITQSVFCLLAQKARELSPATALVGWLYQTVCFITAKYWRTEYRRLHREQEAALMSDTQSTHDTTWEQLAPHVDEAMSQLPDEDRQAVLLRYFQHKPFSEVGRNLNISEDAARMRVNRALEKLRQLLEVKKVACTASALGVLLLEHSATAVPAAVAKSVQIAALKAAQMAGSVSLLGGLLVQITATKLKTTAVACLILIAAMLGFHFTKPPGAPSPDASAPVSALVEKNSAVDGAPLRRASLRRPAAFPPAVEPNTHQSTAALEFYELAQKLQKEGKHDEAMAAYTSSIDLLEQNIGRWERFVEVYFRRAALYLELNDFEHAIADYTRLLEFDPWSHGARINRAANYSLLGQLNEAIADYTFIVNSPDADSFPSMNPSRTVASAYEQRGRIYQDQKEYGKAIADYTNSIQLNPTGGTDMSAYWRRGLSYRATQQWQKASADADVMSDTVLAMIAKIEERSPVAKNAVEIANRACEILENPLAYHLEAKAAAYAKCGTFIPAIHFQEQAIAKSSNASNDQLAAMRARLEQYNSGNAIPVEQPVGK